MSTLADYTGTWTIDPSHSVIGFTARHAMVAKVRGSFQEFDGTFTLDGANPAASTIAFTAQLASIDTGNNDRDNHLRSADFFDVENNKEMTFSSTSITLNGDDEATLVGDLTIKGVTKSVEIDVELNGISVDPFGNTRAGFEGETKISRKDFGLTWNVALEAGGVLVSDEIKVTLDISAIKSA